MYVIYLSLFTHHFGSVKWSHILVYTMLWGAKKTCWNDLLPLFRTKKRLNLTHKTVRWNWPLTKAHVLNDQVPSLCKGLLGRGRISPYFGGTFWRTLARRVSHFDIFTYIVLWCSVWFTRLQNKRNVDCHTFLSTMSKLFQSLRVFRCVLFSGIYLVHLTTIFMFVLMVKIYIDQPFQCDAIPSGSTCRMNRSGSWCTASDRAKWNTWHLRLQKPTNW